MVVLAIEQPGFLLDQPALDSDGRTRGTDAMFAGVIPYSLVAPVGASLNMTSERGSATGYNGSGGFSDVKWQRVALFEISIPDFHDLLERCVLQNTSKSIKRHLHSRIIFR